MKNLKEISKVKFQGKLFHEIPFYENTVALPVEIEIDLDGATSDKPKVVTILGTSAFRKQFEEGFKLDEFEEFLSKIYHLEMN